VWEPVPSGGGPVDGSEAAVGHSTLNTRSSRCGEANTLVNERAPWTH